MYCGADSKPVLTPCRKLPILALNEVYIGESLSARFVRGNFCKLTWIFFRLKTHVEVQHLLLSANHFLHLRFNTRSFVFDISMPMTLRNCRLIPRSR